MVSYNRPESNICRPWKWMVGVNDLIPFGANGLFLMGELLLVLNRGCSIWKAGWTYQWLDTTIVDPAPSLPGVFFGTLMFEPLSSVGCRPDPQKGQENLFICVGNTVVTTFTFHCYLGIKILAMSRLLVGIISKQLSPTTLPKFNMEPKTDGFQKESPIPGCHFQVPC